MSSRAAAIARDQPYRQRLWAYRAARRFPAETKAGPAETKWCLQSRTGQWRGVPGCLRSLPQPWRSLRLSRLFPIFKTVKHDPNLSSESELHQIVSQCTNFDGYFRDGDHAYLYPASTQSSQSHRNEP